MLARNPHHILLALCLLAAAGCGSVRARCERQGGAYLSSGLCSTQNLQRVGCSADCKVERDHCEAGPAQCQDLFERCLKLCDSR